MSTTLHSVNRIRSAAAPLGNFSKFLAIINGTIISAQSHKFLLHTPGFGFIPRDLASVKVEGGLISCNFVHFAENTTNSAHTESTDGTVSATCSTAVSSPVGTACASCCSAIAASCWHSSHWLLSACEELTVLVHRSSWNCIAHIHAIMLPSSLWFCFAVPCCSSPRCCTASSSVAP